MNALAAALLPLLIAADPAPPGIYHGSPADVVQIIRYSAAKTDFWLQDRRVEITGIVDRIERDGLGNYVAIMETRIEEPAAEVSGTIRFHFSRSAMERLSLVNPPTEAVTIQGDLRFIRDLLRRMTRNSVTVDLLNCDVSSEPLPPPVPAPSSEAKPAP